MKNKDKRHTIGTDPEFFMIKKATGKLISAIPYIEGTKYDPEPLPSGGSIQRDNVALEFATDPANSRADFVEKIKLAFLDIKEKIGSEHDIVAIPSADFDPAELEHEEAQQFGCEPDFNAWSVAENEPPPMAEISTFRSCGAHIHVGHVKGDGNDSLLEFHGKLITVKIMDLMHGIISTILDCSKAAIDRKKLYGKAGCHRPKKYGVEYRVLSNFWLKSPMLVMLMDSLTQDALRIIREDKHDELIEKVGGGEVIQRVINEGLSDKAENILKKHIRSMLSKDSLFYLEECMGKIDTYDLKKEWETEASK